MGCKEQPIREHIIRGKDRQFTKNWFIFNLKEKYEFI